MLERKRKEKGRKRKNQRRKKKKNREKREKGRPTAREKEERVSSQGKEGGQPPLATTGSQELP